MNSDHYKVLNVREEATADEIHRAYRALAWRYHPDRNHSSAAATIMAKINEAYEVLGEPKKRSLYDREHSRRHGKIDNAVLLAARETLLKKKWTVSDEKYDEFVLTNGSRRVRVALVRSLTPLLFQEYKRRKDAFIVILALQIDPSVNMVSSTIAVIDVMYSRVYGTFPDDEYKGLFQAFLKAGPGSTHSRR